MYISVSPQYRIRNEKFCSFIVKKENLAISDVSDSSILQIPPFLGYILSELGKDSYEDDIKRISNLTGLSGVAIKAFTDQLICNKEHKQFNISDKVSITFPKNLLIQSDVATNLKHFTVPNFNWNDDFSIVRPSIPITVNLMTTTKCTTDCRYCYAKRDLRPLLTTNEIVNLIDELSNVGVVNIALTGGDIFTIKDWDVIVQKAIDCECMPFISTKTPLSVDGVKRLKQIGINKLQFSIDSCDIQILKELVKVSDDYLTRVSTMFEACSSIGIKITTRSVLTALNSAICQVEELYKFLSKYDCVTEWALTPAFFSEHKRSEYASLLVDNNNLIDVYKFTQRDNLQFPVRLNKIDKDGYKLHRQCTTSEFVKQNQICLGNTTSMSILANGLCSVCEMLYDHPEYILGDIRKSSVREIWNSERALSLYSPNQVDCPLSSPCRSCEEFNKCKTEYGKRVCYSDIAKSGESQYMPDPRCPMANEVNLIL
jgi:radical SAM protein with 4Fe4S-binding SPASM domain